MYVNATDYFDYFGLFSPATSAPYVDRAAVEAHPALAEKGLFVAYGLYDFVFDAARDLEAALDGVQIDYVSRITPFGSHYCKQHCVLSIICMGLFQHGSLPLCSRCAFAPGGLA